MSWLLGAATVAMDLVSIVFPFVLVRAAPRRVRTPVTWKAMATYAALATMRGLTCDYSFNGHAAFVASFVVHTTGYYSPCVMWMCGGLHALGMLVVTHSTLSNSAVDIALAWVFAALVARVSATWTTTWKRSSYVLAHPKDREDVYRARHEVFAEELGQYPCTPDGRLTDDTDAFNQYIVLTRDGTIRGFVSVTPPASASLGTRRTRLSINKHGLHATHADAHEIRVLAVLRGSRGQGLSRVLMHAALRYVEASGGTHITAMARKEVLAMYIGVGMHVVPGSPEVRSGDVEYVHVEATCDEVRGAVGTDRPNAANVQWDLPFMPRPYDACTHGGYGLETLAPIAEHINADVLDAWYPPAPAVLNALAASTDWVHTTPPGSATDLVTAITRARGLDDARCVLLGAGSSDIIYRFFFERLTRTSRVLVLDPTYAEYGHVLSTIGCRVDHIDLRRHDWKLSSECFRWKTKDGKDTKDTKDGKFGKYGKYDMVVLVNPNSPTGIACDDIEHIVTSIPPHVLAWVDETYIDFTGGTEKSMERLAQSRPNLVVCKSMSKAYALSGMRVAYAVGHPVTLEGVRARTPPWIVSRPAQVAGTLALQSPAYYAERITETHALRNEMERGLKNMGWDVVPGACANFLMCSPPSADGSAEVIVAACRRRGVYIRHVEGRFVRIAVKDRASNAKILDVLADRKDWDILTRALDIM